MMIEENPFTIHTDVMNDQEFYDMNYQEDQKNKIGKSQFSQGELLTKVEEFDKPIKYYESFLERDTRDNLEITATALDPLAFPHKSKGDTLDAIEFNARVLEIRINMKAKS